MTAKPKYVAEIAGVREVTLQGTADLRFWQERAAAEGLIASESDGRARLLLSATDARFRGIPFREFSISLAVRGDGGRWGDGYLMVYAFNSRRAFAFIERNVFAAPYHYGRIRIDSCLPADVRLVHSDQTMLGLRMDAGPDATLRSPQDQGDEFWSGPIHLPSGKRDDAERRLFFARIGGQTATYAFGANDEVSIAALPAHPPLSWLLESGFAGRQWSIRPAARHAKSKTYRRGAAIALSPDVEA